MLEPYTKSPCKRDALPTELTARSAEIADFSDNLKIDDLPVAGTGRERVDNGGPQSPEIVPNDWVPEGYTAEEWAGMKRIAEVLNFPRAPEQAKQADPPPKPEKFGITYFVGAEDGPVKIGFTTNMETRLGRLQVGSPVKLKVLATVEGPSITERIYHTQFHWSRLHGEWFERTPAIEAEIARLQAMIPPYADGETSGA